MSKLFTLVESGARRLWGFRLVRWLWRRVVFPGIRAAVQRLAARHGSRHDALHDVMDCLAEVIWQAQRHGAGFDNALYLDCLSRKA